MSTSSHTPKTDKMPECGLYIVATPIGNMRDITLRALDILTMADLILCEDTRVTGKLLSAYDIKTKMMSYHDHNSDKVRPKVLKKLEAGQVIALVSDAGTPLVSDPGYKLVRDCADQNLPVIPIPGASAALAALCSAGVASDRFMFVGFLPPKSTARKEALSALSGIEASLIFYEGVSRLPDCLSDMVSVLGDRRAAVAREMTKRFEDIRRGTLSELSAFYEKKGAPKGEVAIVIERDMRSANERLSDEEVDALLDEALGAMGMSVRDASVYVAEKTGLQKRVLYARALGLTSKGSSDLK